MGRKRILGILYILLAAAVGCVVFFLAMALGIIPGERKESGKQGSQTSSVSILPDSRIQGSGALRKESLDIDGRKTILYFTDSYEQRPLVILQHGLSSRKEDVAEFAAAIAGSGYFVVTPDAAGHGEAKLKEPLSVMDMVVQTAGQFDGIIDYFRESRYVDTDQVGLAGFSLGGLAAFYYTGSCSGNPKVVVSMCSTPDFSDLAGQDAAYTLCMDGNMSVEQDPEERKKIDEQMRVSSPYGKLLDDTDTCFFMLCGSEDEVVPYEGNVRFFEEMEVSAENIQLTVKEGQGHTITEPDMRQVLEYLKNHL